MRLEQLSPACEVAEAENSSRLQQAHNVGSGQRTSLVCSVRKLRPNEVEMMSVPFSIGERVSVVEDSIKVAGGETGTHLSKMHAGVISQVL